MLKNYLKVAVRNITRQKAYSLINIVGLAVGIAGCLLIALWILDETNYDRFQEDADDIHMVLVQGSVLKNNPNTPFPLAETLEKEVPEIVHAARYEASDNALVGYFDRAFYHDIHTADPNFFDIFTFEFLEGDPGTALDRPNSVVITEEIAEKYFGDASAVGQVLTMNQHEEFTVTGVVAEPPGNTIFEFELIVPFEIRLRQARGRAEPGWGWYSPYTFIKLRHEASDDAVAEKISGFLQSHGESDDAFLTLLPFLQVRPFFWNSAMYILVFSAIALFILVIACINYVNLSTARSADRSMEISMRKVSGAGRRSLVTQLLCESIVTTLIAFVVGLSLVEIFLPFINERVGLDLSLRSIDPKIAVPAFLTFVVIVGIAAGAYPAFYLSRVQPVKVMAGRLRSGAGHSSLRRVLVTAQLAIAFFLIVGAQVVYRQLGFISGEDLGYEKNHVINVSLREGVRGHYDELKTELLRGQKILGVSACADDMPYWGSSTGTPEWDGKDPDQKINLYFNVVDYDFLETLGMDMVEGRTFSKEHASDASSGFIVNEEMAKVMGVSPTVGARLTVMGQTGNVIGVVKDFYFQTFVNRIGPLVLLLDTDREYIFNMAIRLNPADIPASLEYVRETWERVVPSYPLEYSFLVEQLDRGYRRTRRLGELSAGFSFLAILIAGLGMFGLASFTAERRTKEVAIRKVFGGSVPDIAFLLSREFIGCLVVAFVIASPVAYYVMHKWLQRFVYRADIDAGLYLVAGLLLSGATFLAVVWQTLNAARRNPAVYLG